MNVLVDTNVWLDIVLHREPHVTASAQAVALLDQPPHRPFLVATSLTTLFYLIRRARTVDEARRATSTLLTRVGVAPVTETILHSALRSELSDFEDAVLQEAALAAGLDAVVTRNPRDFDPSVLPVYTPSELTAALLSQQ